MHSSHPLAHHVLQSAELIMAIQDHCALLCESYNEGNIQLKRIGTGYITATSGRYKSNGVRFKSLKLTLILICQRNKSVQNYQGLRYLAKIKDKILSFLSQVLNIESSCRIF